MTPVDGITPPKNKKAKKPAKQTAKVNPAKVNRNQAPKKDKAQTQDHGNKFTKDLPGQALEKSKHHLVWGISIAIVIIIFIAWASLVLGGKLTISDDQTSGSEILENFTDELNQVWKNFSEDFLKIKNSAEEASTEEERIKQLEESVFPDFDQYK